MFLLNSRLGLFVVTTPRFSNRNQITSVAPLLPKLRGHFAEFLNESYLNALVCSTRPPVSVYGTITFSLARGFSSQREINVTYLSTTIDMPIVPQCTGFADLPTKPTSTLSKVSKHLVRLSSCVTPSLKR